MVFAKSASNDMGDRILGVQVIICPKLVCHRQKEHERHLIPTFIQQVKFL